MPKRGDNIHKRKDGRWEGRYKIGQLESGKTKYASVYGKTYTEVKNKLTNAQSCAIIPAGVSRNKISFSKILFLWMENNKQNYKGATEHKYLYLIEKHIIPELGTIPISQIDSLTINRFIDKKASVGRLDKKGGLSPSYLKTISFIIQSAITFAVREKYRLPLGSTINKPANRRKDLQILSKREQSDFEIYLTDELDYTRLGILMCLHTGLRLGEVCALTWNDIDLNDNIIHIRHTISRVRNNQSGRTTETTLIVETPKTQSSIRDIPISSKLLPHLKEMKQHTSNHYVLSNTNTFLSPRTLEYRFNKLLDNCGISIINFHALRHTFATRCIEAGVDVKSLSEILGHANVGITLNTYVHSSMETKRNQIEKYVCYAE